MGKAFARPLQPVAQQMLAEAHALLLTEHAAELGWAESAQGSNIIKRDLAVEMRCNVRDGRMRFAVLVKVSLDGRCFEALRRKPDVTRWPPALLVRQLKKRGDALAELAAGHRFYQQIPHPNAQRS